MKKALAILLAVGFIFAGCSSNKDGDSTPNTPAVLSIVAVTPTHVTSGGGADGTATANVTGGVPPYSYVWNTTPPQITATAVGLSAGTYTVVVADAAGTIVSASVTIDQPLVIGPVPTTFTQKALVEELTGAWCGFCPDGALILDQIIDAYLGQVLGVSIHEGDAMEISSFYNAIDGAYNVPGFPTGMVNRKTFQGSSPMMSRNIWDNYCWGEVNKDGGCGLAIVSKPNAANPSAYDIEVQAGFNKDLSNDNLRIVVYVIEDKVKGTGSGYNQSNYYSSQSQAAGGSTHPFYNEPNPIPGYEHNHTVRKVITADMGDMIPSSKTKPGMTYKFTETIGTANYKNANVKILAYVYKYDSNTTKHEILNVQEAKLGELQNWD